MEKKKESKTHCHSCSGKKNSDKPAGASSVTILTDSDERMDNRV